MFSRTLACFKAASEPSMISVRRNFSKALHYYRVEGDLSDDLPRLLDFTVLHGLSPQQKTEADNLKKTENTKLNKTSLGCAVYYTHPKLKQFSDNYGFTGTEKLTQQYDDKDTDKLVNHREVRDGVKAKNFQNMLGICESASGKLLVFSRYLLPLKFWERLTINRELYDAAAILKYQQPEKDLDALVNDNDDVINMVEAGSGVGFTRLRIILLFSHPEQDVSPHYIEGDTERQYVDALNNLCHSPLEYRRQQLNDSEAHIADQFFNSMNLEGRVHNQRNFEMGGLPQYNLRQLAIPPRMGSGQHLAAAAQRRYNEEDPCYMQTGAELGGGQAVATGSHVHVPLDERAANMPYSYGTEDISHHVLHNHPKWRNVPPPVYESSSNLQLRHGMRNPAVPRANVEASPRFVVAADQTHLSPWGELRLGVEASATPEYPYGHYAKSSPGAAFQEEVHPTFLQDPSSTTPHMVNLPPPIESVRQPELPSNVTNRNMLSSAASIHTSVKTDAEARLAERSIHHESAGVNSHIEEHPDVNGFISSGQNNNVEKTFTVASPNVNSQGIKIIYGIQTGETNTSPPTEKEDLSFLPELVASAKTAKMENAERVKARAQQDGSVALHEKSERVSNYDKAALLLFFGSIKACGGGISLVGASRINILDVHLSLQAIESAFRPGQRINLSQFFFNDIISREILFFQICLNSSLTQRVSGRKFDVLKDSSFDIKQTLRL